MYIHNYAIMNYVRNKRSGRLSKPLVRCERNVIRMAVQVWDYSSTIKSTSKNEVSIISRTIRNIFKVPNVLIMLD